MTAMMMMVMMMMMTLSLLLLSLVYPIIFPSLTRRHHEICKWSLYTAVEDSSSRHSEGIRAKKLELCHLLQLYSALWLL